jgi:hypothetical protein
MASYSATKYYTSVYNGGFFVGQSVTPQTGILVPTYNSTSPTFGLWNPAGSGFNAVLAQFSMGFVSTTGAPANILYANLAGAGNAIATAAPISAFTSTAPTNCLLGAGNATQMKFTGVAAATNTLTTAGTIFATMGVSQLTTTGATTTAPMYTAIDNIDGKIIVAPGNFFYVVGSAAPLTLFDMTLFWEESRI